MMLTGRGRNREDNTTVQAVGRRTILLSLAIALLLSALPVPGWAESWVPMWAVLVYIYWCMARPELVGLATAFVLGLLLDVQQASVLGENALALVIVAGVVGSTYPRLRMYPLIRQAVAVSLLLSLYLLIRLGIRVMLGIPPTGWLYWAPMPMSVLLWPWIFLLLRDVRRRYALT